MEKFLSNWPHENVFFPVCTIPCFIRFDLVKKSLITMITCKWFPPVSILWWLIIVYILQNATLLHWSKWNGILRNISSHSYGKEIYFLYQVFADVFIDFLSLPFPENLLSQWLYENNISHFCLFFYLIQKCYYKINTFLSPTK